MEPARVSLLGLEEAASVADEVGVPARLAPLNVFRVLLRSPRSAKAIADLLLHLLSAPTLDHRIRELVIMRIGWVTRSDYEWTQHWTIGREVFGVSAEDFVAVREWENSPRFGPAERAALEATDQTLSTGSISAEACRRCVEELGEDALIELCLVIGTWRTISQLTRSLDIPLEEGVESWPPDQVVPT